MNPLEEARRHRLDRLASLLSVLEVLPVGALVVDLAGKIVAASSEAERLFGYAPGELEGASVELLVPQKHRAAHVRERDRFMGALRSRQMAAGRDLEGLRKDGSAVPLQIGLSQIEVDEGAFVLAIVLELPAR